MTPQSSLASYVNWYANRAEYELSPGYIEQLLIAVRLLERSTGSTIRLADLDDELVNGFVDWLRDQQRAAATIRNRRNCILAMWRAAFDERLLDTPPLRIRKIRSRRTIPQAWSRDEVRRLAEVAASHRRGQWWQSLICAAWDTALRLGDLLRLEWSQIPIGQFRVRQHKTGHDVLVDLSQHTRTLLERLERDGPLIWPLPFRREELYRQMRQLVARAEIAPGTFRWIRRGAITSVEGKGGNSTRIAGHRDRAVTLAHYIDPRLLADVVRPEPLDGGQT